MEKRFLPGVAATLNVDNCVAYLRGIGVDVDERTAAAWADTERVGRYLRNEKRAKRCGYDMQCRNGHEWYGEWAKRRRAREPLPVELCPTCGLKWCFLGTRWIEARDGTITDLRPFAGQWRPRDEQP